MRSFYLLLLILFIAAVPGVQAQEFVNGGFDENFFFNDMLNPEQELINLGMDGVYSFGPEDEANIDIITSSSYEGGPETGSWFCGMSGGATDKLALEIEPALVMNQEYTISFYDKAHSEFVCLIACNVYRG